MSSKFNIFITGATGFIGGSVVARLLQHPDAKSFQITALVRSAEKAEKLKTLGLHTIIGSYTDNDLSFLTEAAAHADVVFEIADADNAAPTRAIMKGMKQKYEKDGRIPILIHTSGTAVIMDDARGMHGDHTVYSDLDVDKLSALPETALHKDVDNLILEADKAGYLKSYFILPGTIFGLATGPLVDLGVQNVQSIQIPYFIKASIARKQGGYFGKGLNRWPAVHIDDTADLYIILFDAIRSSSDGAAHGLHGYYFVENCEYSAIELARAISEALVDLGVGTTREPSAFSQEECDKYFGAAWPFLATNSLARADRSRSLGWKPVHGKEALFASVKPDVERLLK
ncbi:NAD(P)-binding protein [Phlegmacium glaucopus]|nr:NAD(P)-binding protein [Phlegmacium glaucopus]